MLTKPLLPYIDDPSDTSNGFEGNSFSTISDTPDEEILDRVINFHTLFYSPKIDFDVNKAYDLFVARFKDE